MRLSRIGLPALVVWVAAGLPVPGRAQEVCPLQSRPRGDWGPPLLGDTLRLLMPPAFYQGATTRAEDSVWAQGERSAWVFYAEMLEVRWATPGALRAGIRHLRRARRALVAGRVNADSTMSACVLRFPGVWTLSALVALADTLRRAPGVVQVSLVRAARYGSSSPDSTP